MKKSYYQTPVAGISEISGIAFFCASNQGNSEDFEKGSGFSFDLFESVNPF